MITNFLIKYIDLFTTNQHFSTNSLSNLQSTFLIIIFTDFIIYDQPRQSRNLLGHRRSQNQEKITLCSHLYLQNNRGNHTWTPQNGSPRKQTFEPCLKHRRRKLLHIKIERQHRLQKNRLRSHKIQFFIITKRRWTVHPWKRSIRKS